MEEYEGFRLEQVFIHRSSDQQVAGQFNVSKLREGLVNSTLGRLTGDQMDQVMSDLVRALRVRVRAAKAGDGVIHFESVERSAAEKPGRDFKVALSDWVIREEAENALRRDEYRLAHVLYALSFRGRASGGKLGHWASAADVLDWLYSRRAHPELKEDVPVPPTVVVDRWTPLKHETAPTTVIKQGSTSEMRRAVPFDYERFLRSVQKVMLGRPNAKRQAEFVTWLVLRPLTGQKIVSTSQLRVGVLDRLRQIDDVAYLRWAIITKSIERIDDFDSEVRALIERPSPKLIFNDHVAKPIETERIQQSGSNASDGRCVGECECRR